jgi:thiamine-phosphate pyrophosphorylase
VAKRVIHASASPNCLVAIGGITRDNARSVFESGASAVAVISAVIGADDPAAASAELIECATRAATLRERGMP